MLTLLSKPSSDGRRRGRRALFCATGVLALSGLPLFGPIAAEATSSRRRASRCIFILLNGGVSQVDTFDLKPNAPAEIRGPYKPIATSAPGVFITEKLPRLAGWMHKVAVVRSLHHEMAAHNTGAAYMLSGHSPGSDDKIAPTADDHPTYGSVVARLAPPGPLPPFVLTPTLLFDMGFPTPSAGGGWLGHAHDPFPVVRNKMMSSSPSWNGELPVPDGMTVPAGVTLARMKGREELSHVLEDLTSPIAGQQIDAHRRQAALDLILSPQARRAFDLSNEDPRLRDRYGCCEMGQVFLLARRLIEAGVRFVTANAVSNPPNTTLSAFQIWDTHHDHFRLYDSHLMPELDQALSALLEDLSQRRPSG